MATGFLSELTKLVITKAVDDYATGFGDHSLDGVVNTGKLGIHQGGNNRHSVPAWTIRNTESRGSTKGSFAPGPRPNKCEQVFPKFK